MKQRQVTIIVTVYHIEKYLDRFFSCLHDQSCQDYEVLIIEDGSTDHSPEICRSYAQRDDRIRLIEVEHIGISAARNLALGELHTPFVTSLDGDDYFDKDYLKHLLDAQEKYDADLVISNVVYRDDQGNELKRFSPRQEALFEKKDFSSVLPALLEEERLNYLYGKLYKTEYLKDIRVQPDVRQGSDTMINCQYVMKIDRIAVIEDYDYSYIRYKNSRAVTSFSEKATFSRLLRINHFVSDVMEEHGYLNEEMVRAIDGRFLFSGRLTLTGIAQADLPLKTKLKKAKYVVDSEEYQLSYHRQKEKGNLTGFPFEVIAPGEEQDFIVHWHKLLREQKQNIRRRRLKSRCPDLLFRIWHKGKIALGLIEPDRH